MINEKIFENLKSVYELAFDNFKLITEQQKKLVEMFLKQSSLPNNEEIAKLYEEWLNSTQKALDDFKGIVFKGIDFMIEAINKAKK